MYEKCKVFIVTGREGTPEIIAATKKWLAKHDVVVDELVEARVAGLYDDGLVVFDDGLVAHGAPPDGIVDYLRLSRKSLSQQAAMRS